MKLYCSHTSPFARKVRIVALEKGLAAEIQEITVNPWGGQVSELRGHNPIGKVPALVGRKGEALYDSRVICAYLDSLAPEPALIPAGGPERFAVMKAEALADNALDGSVSLVLELRRPEIEQSKIMMEHWASAMERSAGAMQDALKTLPSGITLGHINFAVALLYFDFRHPHVEWRTHYPELSAWLEQFRQRPSIAGTAPPVA